ncbi:hypothetical protein IX51_08635 [uncultured archaeon]|nr:hypothetical protein IX51_08635 [uncultured archaeon]
MSNAGKVFYDGVRKGLKISEIKIQELLQDAMDKYQKLIKRGLLAVKELEYQLDSEAMKRYWRQSCVSG